MSESCCNYGLVSIWTRRSRKPGATVWVDQHPSNPALDSLIEFPEYPTNIQESTDIKISTNNDSTLLNEPALLDEHILGESDRSLSNFEILFRVATIVREAIQYLKNDATIQSPSSSYTAIESRLRNICFALIQAAGPNSLVFCDSIALALRYDFAIQLLEQTSWINQIYVAFYSNSMYIILGNPKRLLARQIDSP